MSQFQMSRLIEIDAGHRVPDHASKCKSLHGHRYRIEATVIGGLRQTGPERGMVMDFGFLKEEMMAEIHDPCDHALILWVQDPLASTLVVGPGMGAGHLLPAVDAEVRQKTFCLLPEAATGKLYLLDCVPTAEELARHWFCRLAPKVSERTGGAATLRWLDVFETPNCRARFPIDA